MASGEEWEQEEYSWFDEKYRKEEEQVLKTTKEYIFSLYIDFKSVISLYTHQNNVRDTCINSSKLMLNTKTNVCFYVLSIIWWNLWSADITIISHCTFVPYIILMCV